MFKGIAFRFHPVSRFQAQIFQNFFGQGYCQTIAGFKDFAAHISIIVQNTQKITWKLLNFDNVSNVKQLNLSFRASPRAEESLNIVIKGSLHSSSDALVVGRDDRPFFALSDLWDLRLERSVIQFAFWLNSM